MHQENPKILFPASCFLWFGASADTISHIIQFMASVVFYMENDHTIVHKLENEEVSIGRHPESTVKLTCPSSSGRHAVIKHREDGYYVQDLGSSNGTRVNGAEIEEALLKDGDRVGFGDVQAVFYEGDPPAILEDEPRPDRVAKALPAPAPVANDEPPAPRSAPRGRALSPVRRAYAKKSPGGYPDQTESGCLSAFIVIGLFALAFFVGIAMRHVKEKDGNILTDTLEKVFGSMPKIKIEKSEE